MIPLLALLGGWGWPPPSAAVWVAALGAHLYVPTLSLRCTRRTRPSPLWTTAVATCRRGGAAGWVAVVVAACLWGGGCAMTVALMGDFTAALKVVQKGRTSSGRWEVCGTRDRNRGNLFNISVDSEGHNEPPQGGMGPWGPPQASGPARSAASGWPPHSISGVVAVTCQ